MTDVSSIIQQVISSLYAHTSLSEQCRLFPANFVFFFSISSLQSALLLDKDRHQVELPRNYIT